MSYMHRYHRPWQTAPVTMGYLWPVVGYDSPLHTQLHTPLQADGPAGLQTRPEYGASLPDHVTKETWKISLSLSLSLSNIYTTTINCVVVARMEAG